MRSRFGSRQPWSNSHCVVLLSIILLAPPVAAETVLLKTGNEFGVGWLFLDADGRCRIATPRHVIETGDGVLTTPELLQRDGRTSATDNPIGASNPDVDLAFLDASQIIADDGCTDSRLTNRPLDALLARMDTGVLNMITELDQQTIRVEVRAASIDKFGGGVIAVVPVADEENLKSGMSGSVILVNGQPLAMLFWVDPGGVGLAYRFDAIADYNSAAIGSEPHALGEASSIIRDVVLLEGSLGGGSLNALRSNGGYSELNYERRRVTLHVDLGSAIRIRGVRIDAPSGQDLGVRQVIVEADPGSGRFGYVRSCEGAKTAPRMLCAFAPRIAAQLRVTFVEQADSLGKPAVLASLEVLGAL